MFKGRLLAWYRHRLTSVTSVTDVWNAFCIGNIGNIGYRCHATGGGGEGGCPEHRSDIGRAPTDIGNRCSDQHRLPMYSLAACPEHRSDIGITLTDIGNRCSATVCCLPSTSVRHRYNLNRRQKPMFGSTSATDVQPCFLPRTLVPTSVAPQPTSVTDDCCLAPYLYTSVTDVNRHR